MSTRIANHGVWEEISMNVSSTLPVEGWWWYRTDILVTQKKDNTITDVIIILCLNFTIQPFNISELFPIYDALNKKLGTCLDGVLDDKNEAPAI